MINLILQAIEGIEIYSVISLVLFFAFFMGVIVRAFRLDKAYREKMKRMPLERESFFSGEGVDRDG